MFIYFLIAMLAEVMVLALYLFPDASSFLPLPTALYNAFGYVGEVSYFFLSLFGADVATALVSCIGIGIKVGLALLTYRAISNFRVPVISRFTHGAPVKEL